jgi:signal transduction histidine kinase/CheY-like chemotaxis protein
VGLRRALWVPVADSTHVKGLILLGSKSKPLSSSAERANFLAAELGLALAMEGRLQDARIRTADLGLVRRILEASPETFSKDMLLNFLVADCVQHSDNGESPGAAFAVIGCLQTPKENFSASSAVDFRWRDGDDAWTRAVKTDPLAKLWRRALETHKVIGGDPPGIWSPVSVARVVAFPLEAEGQLLGTLVLGLPDDATSIATLDRLELRARLASFALLRRKQQEEEAQRARAEQNLLDLVNDPLLLLDPSGKIAATSRGARELFRHAAQTAGLPSEHLADLFGGGDRERLRRWLQNALDSSAGHQALKNEAPLAELQNGVKMRLHLASRLPTQQTALLLEPEEARQGTKRSDHAETELQNVIEWLEEGVVLFDERENVRAINTRFEQMAGLSPEESGKSRTLEELIARLAGQAAEPAQFAERWRELAHNLQGGVREQFQMVRPAPRILERAARPVLDSIGRQLGRVEIYRDLTAQRVFQSKLLQTEKLAALGQMVSGIAHELSNPLTSILGYAQRLLVGPNAPGRTEEVQQIYQEAERASSILRQLLLNARETIPDRRLVSLNQVVMRAMELQRFHLAAEKIRVELELDPVLPFVHGDAGQLQQVLINLLGNARQALEEQSQGGVIRIRTKRISERRVLLEVEDSGPGIPQAIQARIFDPFFTTKPAGVGTGLGLAIVLGVVREHGGHVRVKSPPQGGALFQIELPAASERQREEALTLRPRQGKTSFAEPPQFTVAESPPTAPFESRKGTRVLVVEDEPTVARLIADVLEDEGMQVDVLLDGREALDRAARESYDLVICDMKMPGLDGQRFYRSLERNGNALRERFLFVTGDVIAAQTREFLERKRLPHVAKPFRVEELTEKVHAVLQTQAHLEPSAADAARKNVARNG